MRTLKGKFLLWLMNTGFYSWLLLKIIPYIRFTTYYTSFRGWKYHRGYRLLQPGDILLCRDSKKLTTVLIGGEFTHAAFCVSVEDQDKLGFEIAEMTHENYTKSYFFDVCDESDRVVILRCADFDPAYTQKVIQKCLSFHSAVYDVHFTFGVKALYCSELVYQSDFERRLRVDLTDLAGLGIPYISPTGLYHAENVNVVWDSDSEKR